MGLTVGRDSGEYAGLQGAALAAAAAAGYFAGARPATTGWRERPLTSLLPSQMTHPWRAHYYDLTSQCALPVDIARTALRHAPVLIF